MKNNRADTKVNCIDYHLIQGQDLTSGTNGFSLTVKSYLESGWELHGGTTIVFHPRTEHRSEYCEFFQAVRLSREEEDNEE